MKPSEIHRSFVPRPFAATPLTLIALIAASCGGVGGSEGPGGTGGKGSGFLDDGDYTVDDYTYQSQRAPGFNPLGKDGALLTPRTELYSVLPQPYGGPSFDHMEEGPDAGFAEIPGTSGLFGPGRNIRGAAAGELDQDAEEELVAVEIANGGALLRVWRADRQPNGTWEVDSILSIPASGWNFEDARITLADVDGDFRDELIVVGRDYPFEWTTLHARLWVFDDPDDGLDTMLEVSRDAAHTNMWGLPADLDGDRRPEIVLALEGDTTQLARLAVRTYALEPDAKEFGLVQGWRYLVPNTDKLGSKAIVGDFDYDGRDEIAAVSHDQTPNTELDIWMYEFDGSDWQQFAYTRIIHQAPTSQVYGREWDATGYEIEGEPDALAMLMPLGGTMTVLMLGWNPFEEYWWLVQSATGLVHYENQGATIVAGDADSDGNQDLFCGTLRLTGSELEFRQSFVVPGDEPTHETLPTLSYPSTELAETQPVLVPGDFDGDGLTVAFTGRRSLGLASPIPLVLMHAPPTKAGISQNYVASETAYSVATSIGQSIGVTTQVTASLSVGYEVEDFTGSFGSHAKGTIGASLAHSEIDSTETTVIHGYTGAYDADVVIFQGTLYESYEYEVLSAPEPDLVGAYVTIDLPVQTKTYSWTLDYFNSVVDEADRVPDAMHTHTVGDPASYPLRQDLFDKLASYVHWADDELIPVNQGGGTRFSTVDLSEEHASEDQTSVFAEFESGFKAGYVTVEASIGIEESHAYSISYGTSTTYGGTVGGIADPADYEAWRYDWGLAVENVGMLAGGSNEPIGLVEGERPFQVIRYWADPNGAAYAH